MRQLRLKLFLVLIISLSLAGAHAQTCNGSLGDPVFKQSFGAGTTQLEVGPPLSPGITTLEYTRDPCAENGGSYGFPSFMQGCHADTWHHLNNDHTGDPYGYFMLINGPGTHEVVYSQKVPGSMLCPNTTYEFSAWIMNVLILSDATANWVLPNLTLSIETADGKVLKSVATGDMPETTSPVWNQYFDYFIEPADGGDVYVKIYDNQTRQGNGNDYAVDDIAFIPCGPIINAGFNAATGGAVETICAGQDAEFTMVGAQQGYDHPVYQWQTMAPADTSWSDIPGANGTTLTKTFTNPSAGLTQYRLGVQSSQSTGPACRIYSTVLYVYVNPIPDAGLPPVSPACAGQPLQLTATPGGTYLWTGPNGFTSTEQNPLVSASAQASDAGIYKVTFTLYGCSITASTAVSVYNAINPVVSSDTTICQGSSVTLSAAKTTNATTYTWLPATGLDNTDKAIVNATPVQTTTYTVTLANGGCTSPQRSVTVTVIPTPVVSAGPSKRIQAGESVVLDGTLKGNNVQFFWTPTDYLDNPQSLTPVATPPYNMHYTLHAIAANGCGMDTSGVNVRVYQKVTIPNTFTPNGDGVNDFWDIKNLDTYPESLIQVFNRYGQPVYQGSGYAKPWNGTHNGLVLPTGTYYYIIDLNNGTPKLSGWVLIVR